MTDASRTIFLSNGADGASGTPDDLLMVITANGKGAATWGPPSSGGDEVLATRGAMALLGNRERIRRMEQSPRSAVSSHRNTSRGVDRQALQKTDDATGSETVQQIQSAVDYVRSTDFTVVVPQLTDRLQREARAWEHVPYGAGEAAATVRTILAVGSTHRTMKAIASRIDSQYEGGAWPDDARGQSHVLNTGDGVDPWGMPLRYRRQGIEFTLTSAGPDMLWDTGDDPQLWVYHDRSRDFFPNWNAGEYTTGLQAITAQLTVD